MKSAFSILFSALFICVVSAIESTETDSIDEQIARMQSEFGVQIHYRYDPALFFPETWLQPAMDMDAGEIDVEEAARLMPIIRQFLQKHPISLIQADLQHIYLLEELSFRGKRYGSTHLNKSMYIVADKSIHIIDGTVVYQYDDDFLACRLHSEFSSILMEQHPFPDDEWQQSNPADFRYGGTGFEMIDLASCYDSTERSCSEGFLVNYCRSSLQNDFNMISAWLFTKQDELDALAGRHSRLGRKVTLTKRFYTSLSNQYTFE